MLNISKHNAELSFKELKTIMNIKNENFNYAIIQKKHSKGGESK